MMTDTAQRALLWCVLDDALALRLRPVHDCPACEIWMEHGPCPRHQAGWETWAQYLGLSARLEAAAPLPAWSLGPADAQVIAQAVPDALAWRAATNDPVDAGLTIAYRMLAAQLAASTVRR